MNEWTDIPGYEGLYQITPDGRIRNYAGKVLKLSVPRNSREYPAINLCKDCVKRRYSVHRLVALTFIGPPPFEGAQIRHLDGNHVNNSVSNLAWGSAKENTEDRRRHGTPVVILFAAFFGPFMALEIVAERFRYHWSRP